MWKMVELPLVNRVDTYWLEDTSKGMACEPVALGLPPTNVILNIWLAYSK